MHRSGTSAMARVLSLAGAALPQDVMGSSPFNEAGHWEPVPVADFNDRLLAKVDTGWDSMFGPRRNRRGALPLRRHLGEARRILREQYDAEPLIVVKDPRLTLLVDLWHEALVAEGFEPSYVIMVRQPQEVAASLARRDNIPINRGLLLWATYMTQAEILTRQARRLYCSYDQLLASPETVLDGIEDALGVEFSRRTAKSQGEIADFLKPSLRHHAAARLEGIGGELAPVGRLADYLFDLTNGVVRNDDVASETRTWLGSLDAMFTPILVADEARARSAATAAEGEMDALRTTIGEASGVIAELREREAAMRSSLDEHAIALAAREQDVEMFRELAAANARDADALAAVRAELTQLSQLNDTRTGAYVAAVAQHEMAMRRVRGELEIARSALEAERDGSAELADALSTAQAELSEARLSFTAHAETYSGRIALSEAACHAEALHKAHAQEALAITRLELAEARDAFAAHAEALHEQIGTTEAARHAEAVHKARAEEALAITRAELAEARNAHDVARHALHVELGNGARLSQERDALAMHAETLFDQVTATEAARHGEAVHKAEAEEALYLTRVELAEARESLANAQTELAEARESLANAQTELAEAREALANAQTELAEAREALANAQIAQSETGAALTATRQELGRVRVQSASETAGHNRSLATAHAQRMEADRLLKAAHAAAAEEQARFDQERSERDAQLHERNAQLHEAEQHAARLATAYRRSLSGRAAGVLRKFGR